MKIVIAGAGEVGTHLARMLSEENHEIVMIDNDEERLKVAASKLDIITYFGNCSSINLLTQANVQKSDLFIGVTQLEANNILSATLAKKLGVKKCLARVDSIEFTYNENIDYFTGMGIDFLFYPERITANEIVSLIQQTGISDLVPFAGGKLIVGVLKLKAESPLINRSAIEVNNELADDSLKICAVTRGNETYFPDEDLFFFQNDMIHVITTKVGIGQVAKLSGKKELALKNIMIMGGSRIGRNAAKELGKTHYVKLIEINRTKSYELSNQLQSTLIINGDGRNIDLLMEEGLPKMDAFIAVTGNTESNIISCMLAKQMGVKVAIAEVENIDYIPLAKNMDIDFIINKKISTANKIFKFTMSDDYSVVKSLTDTNAELVEFTVQPDSPITEDVLENITIPEDSQIIGVVRGKYSFLVKPNTLVKPFDKVVVFTLEGVSKKLRKLFVAND